MDITYEEVVTIFKALCDERRLRIIEILKGGEECACILGEQLNMAQSSLSYHMKVLCDSGIIESRQEGKWTHYRISRIGSEFAIELLAKLTNLDVIDLIS